MPVEIPAARTALKEDSLGPPPIIKVNTKLSFKIQIQPIKKRLRGNLIALKPRNITVFRK